MRLFYIFLAIAIVFAIALVFLSTENAVVVTEAEVDEAAEDVVDITVDTAEETASTLDDFFDQLLVRPRTDLIRVLLVIGGVILMIAGWRIYDFVVVIAGFLIGASIVVSLVTTDSTFVEVAAFLIGGLIGAILSVFLYYFAVFIIGAYIGILLANSIGSELANTPVDPLILIIAALIGGMILLSLSFQFVVVLSALVGAQMLTLGLALDYYWTIIFAIIGIIVQFALMRNFAYDFRRRPSRAFLLPRWSW